METVRGEKNLREIKMISVNNSSVEGRGLQPAPWGGGGGGGRLAEERGHFVISMGEEI